MNDPRTTAPGAADNAHMAWSFPIGRIAGIQLRVHVSFFLIVALFALAGNAENGPGVVSSLVWLVLIFTCVVAHELSHSLVGRAHGAVVHEIVLLPIGGVSRLEKLPETPSDEFALAIAGPLMSFGLAAAAGVIAAGARVQLLPIDLLKGAIVAKLFWFNLIIGGFNLLPAFPLDGGRVLRSLLERRHSLERATRMAARIGRWLAVALVVVGLFVDLWLTFIGMFVYFGASVEEAATVTHLRLRGLLVRDLMVTNPVTVPADTPVDDVKLWWRHSTQRAFPVVDARGYIGMLDPLAVLRAEPGRTAGECVAAVPYVAPLQPLEEQVVPLVARVPGRAVAVVDGENVVGVLRIEDVQHLLSEPEAADVPEGWSSGGSDGHERRSDGPWDRGGA